MSVPTDSFRGALTYFALLPIVFPLWLTLPDTRKYACKSRPEFSKTIIFQGGGEEEEDNQPLDLSWPDTFRERVTYLSFLPIIIPLWLTLPDTRKESGQRAHTVGPCTLPALQSKYFYFKSKYLVTFLFTQIFTWDFKIKWPEEIIIFLKKKL